MKRLISFGLCVMMILLLLLPAAMAEETVLVSGTARVQFSLRVSPDMDAKKYGTADIGEKLSVLEAVDETWCKVRVGAYSGYALWKWVRMPQGVTAASLLASAAPAAPAATEAPAAATPEPSAESSEVTTATTEATAEPLQSALPTATVSSAKQEGAPLNQYTSLTVGDGMSETLQYWCMTRKKCVLRAEPSTDAKTLTSVDKGDDLRVFSYGTEWSYVGTKKDTMRGYVQTVYLFHFSSLDRFLYEVPDYEQYRMTGYVVMTDSAHITDKKNLYGGNTLVENCVVFVKGFTEEGFNVLIRRDWDTIPLTAGEYHPLVDWREAKAGDVIGGYTQFYGEKEGGIYFHHRKHNIRVAMEKMNGTIIKSGEEYSFLTNVGPVTKGTGYETAGITGGVGSALGGGICHTSTLMYQAALSLPFLITEREPHTDDGTFYAPLEFDATVGAYSDFKFVNTLPYDIRMDAIIDMESNTITVQFVCLETVDAALLAEWDGSALETN